MNAGAVQYEPSFMSRTPGRASSAGAVTASSVTLLPKEPKEELEEKADRQTDVNHVFPAELFIKLIVPGVETLSTPQMTT